MDLRKNLSKETLSKIIDSHISRYSMLLTHKGNAYYTVNRTECEHYLGIWQKAKADLETGKELGNELEQELYDYISSGETEFLTENEIVYCWGKGLLEDVGDW